VAFFVTARHAGEADRVAFTDVVMEQLAELLGRPMPAYLTDATRDTHFYGLLTEAADLSRQQGEQLVLLVDGLDEDLGLTADGDPHSIAALLPAVPPAGLRVVAAGRAEPGDRSTCPTGTRCGTRRPFGGYGLRRIRRLPFDTGPGPGSARTPLPGAPDGASVVRERVGAYRPAASRSVSGSGPGRATPHPATV
jgi:hypothetical protein